MTNKQRIIKMIIFCIIGSCIFIIPKFIFMDIIRILGMLKALELLYKLTDFITGKFIK